MEERAAAGSGCGEGEVGRGWQRGKAAALLPRCVSVDTFGQVSANRRALGSQVVMSTRSQSIYMQSVEVLQVKSRLTCSLPFPPPAPSPASPGHPFPGQGSWQCSGRTGGVFQWGSWGFSPRSPRGVRRHGESSAGACVTPSRVPPVARSPCARSAEWHVALAERGQSRP